MRMSRNVLLVCAGVLAISCGVIVATTVVRNLRKSSKDVDYVRRRGGEVGFHVRERSSLPRQGVPSLLRIHNISIEKGDVSAWNNFHKLWTLQLVGIEDNADTLQALRLPELVRVEIEGTCISDRSLTFLRHCQRVQTLSVRSSCVSGQFLESLSCWNSLKVLWMEGTALNDQNISALLQASVLEELYLQSTQLSDDGLQKLMLLPRLNKINVQDTKVSAKGVSQFASEKPDVWLIHNVNQAP